MLNILKDAEVQRQIDRDDETKTFEERIENLIKKLALDILEEQQKASKRANTNSAIDAAQATV